MAHVRDHGGDWMALAVHYASELDPVARGQRAVEAGWRWFEQSRDCTSPDTPAPPPGERRIAVVVSGLGTDSGGNSAWEIDTVALGWQNSQTTWKTATGYCFANLQSRCCSSCLACRH